jgi:outer membrane biosynthesis protein TonB
MADPEMTSRPTNDAYTGMLAIALLALIAGSALMYLDYSQYPMRKPDPLPKAPVLLPKSEPPAPKVEAPDEKKDETKKDEKKDDAKEEMKKDDAKKDEPKKEEMKKDDEKKDAEKKEAEKKDEKKESSSLGSPRSPRSVSPLLELGIGVAHEDAPVLRRRRMLAVTDEVAERTVDQRPNRRSSLDRQAG